MCTVLTPEAEQGSNPAARWWAQFAKTGNLSFERLVDGQQLSEPSNLYLGLSSPLEAKQDVQESYVAPAKSDD